MAKKQKSSQAVVCSIKSLPSELHEVAATTAISINPLNAPARELMALSMTALSDSGIEPSTVLERSRLSVYTSRYWGTQGVRLTVGFMESIQDDLAARIISHMNAWRDVAKANVEFTRTKTSPQVRITRNDSGYWSYLGSDITHIPANQPTMCLQGFTMRTPESEFIRVVRHETGHTLGMPHEHLRRDLVNRLDVQKTIAYFLQTQGWDETTTRQQVLTPIDERSLLSPTPADVTSIMCYQIDKSCTKDGQPIIGGSDLDEFDKSYAARIYPLAVTPPTPPPGEKITRVIKITGDKVEILIDDKPVPTI